MLLPVGLHWAVIIAICVDIYQFTLGCQYHNLCYLPVYTGLSVKQFVMLPVGLHLAVCMTICVVICQFILGCHHSDLCCYMSVYIWLSVY